MILDLTNQLPNKVISWKNGYVKCNYSINMEFDKFQSYSLIGNNSEFKTRMFCVLFNGLEIKYDGLKTKKYPLNNSIQTFINAINGKQDYRLGLDLTLKITKVLESIEKY
jgi:hypothetical protein